MLIAYLQFKKQNKQNIETLNQIITYSNYKILTEDD